MFNEAKISRPRPRSRPRPGCWGRGRDRGQSFEVKAEVEANFLRSRPRPRPKIKLWIKSIKWWLTTFLLGCWFFCCIPRPDRGQMFEAKAQAEAKALRPRQRLTPKFWPRGHFGLEDLTSLVTVVRVHDYNALLLDWQPRELSRCQIWTRPTHSHQLRNATVKTGFRKMKSWAQRSSFYFWSKWSPNFAKSRGVLITTDS